MWIACLLAFISSACTLVIEIIAGRIMAPYIGVSLYTWTSVIGVVLAGMSVGNFVGGVVADRFASRRTLGLIFMAGGVSYLAMSWVVRFIREMHRKELAYSIVGSRPRHRAFRVHGKPHSVHRL